MREVRRTLRDDGTLWLNLGFQWDGRGNCIDTPHMVRDALVVDGWFFKAPIVWANPNPMPESVSKRPTSAHEMLFLMAKHPKTGYAYDQDAIREPSLGIERPNFDGHRGELPKADVPGRTEQRDRAGNHSAGRNRRSVWEIATQPFSASALGSGHQARGGEGAGGGGRRRITSPGCPVHGDSFDPASIGVGDGHGAEGRQSHTERSQTRRALGHVGDFGSIQPHPGQQSEPDSSDSPRQQCDPAATDRSTQSHRTAPSPETSQPCMPSAETDGHTGDTSESPLFAGSDPDTPASTPSGDSDADGQARDDAETEWSRLRRCKCSWVNDTTEPDHFATFPEKLVEPCILTTSEWGCCPECGAPWERVVERAVPHDPGRGNSKLRDATGLSPRAASTAKRQLGQAYQDQLDANPPETTGWDPTCDCLTMDERVMVVPNPVPCRILDPFAGSGTVGLVAERLGRHSVLIDAKEEYAIMARHRTAQMGLMTDTGRQ